MVASLAELYPEVPFFIGYWLGKGCRRMPVLYPASLQAADLRGVWIIFSAAGLLVAIIVYALIFFSILRWRRRAHDSGVPPQFKTNASIEITSVVIPLIMVIGLFYISYVREGVVDFLKPAPYAVVNVRAFRWAWSFSYPGHGIVQAGTPQSQPTLVLPQGKMTQINLYSDDVDHSFWVPAFLFKRDALPGYTNHFDVTPTQLGAFRGVCSEYCGLDHAFMTFTVRVVPLATYDRWLASGGTAAL